MNIVIADHYPVFRLGIKNLLNQSDGYHIIGKVSDGKKLIASIRELNPDLLLLEIDLPNINGLNCLRELKSNFPDLKILVLSCHPEEVYALSAIKAGASGYIEKTKEEQAVLYAIEQVSLGNIYLSKKVHLLQDNSYHNRNTLKYRKLSTREVEVLDLLAKGSRNKEIAQSLNINEKTVSTYKTRLLKKLNVDNIADLINHSRLTQVVSFNDR